MRQHFITTNGLWSITFSSPNQNSKQHRRCDCSNNINYQQLLSAWALDQYRMIELDRITIQSQHDFPSIDKFMEKTSFFLVLLLNKI